jgi:HD-GYP domain-containing protein (c-di-GMP phosphodiesterase class II)
VVRLTALLRSRAANTPAEKAIPSDEKTSAPVPGKGQSMYLQSGDLAHLLNTLSSPPVSERAAGVPPRHGDTQPPVEVPHSSAAQSGEEPKAAGESPSPGTGLESSEDAAERYLSAIRRESLEADAVYIELLDFLEELFAGRSDDHGRTVERLVSLAGRLIDACSRSNTILRKAIRLKKEKDTLTAHSLNTAILAIKIGQIRGFKSERLFSLALCSLLGDIGMARVNPEILSKKSALTPDEFNEITLHVRYSMEILSRDFPEFPFLAPIVGQIHERENGSGYPHGLKGENIHEFAKIIGLCDVYIAMISRKAHRDDFSGYATLQQIISRRGIDFQPHIIKSLIDVISVFPVESLVKLNNGSICRVIDISPMHPTRPKLFILVNSDGEHLKSPKFLDLEREPLLYVEKPDVEEGVVTTEGQSS